ncbi:MAG: hypothetical protein KA479_09550 [Saprospiraceae bacterium]|nr:hypothetical protein [Saprospiraceae bacterium]
MKDLKQLEYKAIFDIRPEALAASILAQDDSLSLEQIVLAPVGPARRRSGPEIQQIQKRFFPEMEVWQISMARKGLFDGLPEGLFLRTEEDYPSKIEKSKAITRQIQDARSFFLPFEQVLYWPRIEAEQLEQKWADHFPNFLSQLWGLDMFGDLLDDRQRFLLCYILPLSFKVAGNWPLTALCFQSVLGKEVTIDFTAPVELPIPQSDSDPSNMRLGESVILGEFFRDDLPVLQVHIHQVALDELDGYLEGGGIHRVLEELLYSYFIPIEVPVITRIHLYEGDRGVYVGHSVLGIGTILDKRDHPVPDVHSAAHVYG